MSCNEVQTRLMDYVQGDLAGMDRQRIDQHLDHCEACRRVLAAEHGLDLAMKQRFAIPAPSPGFQARMLAAAGAPSGSSRRWSHAAMGGAVAAAVGFGLALGLWLNAGPNGVVPATAERPLPVGEPLAQVEAPVEKTVRLAFRSAEVLENVTLTLELPPNVELSTWPGQRQLSWQVTLDEGDNVLSLPLTLLFPGEGELVATLDTGARQKTFRAAIPAYPDAASGDSGS